MFQRAQPPEVKSIEALVGRYEEYRNRQKRLELLLVSVAGGVMSFVLVLFVFFNSAFLHEAVEVIRSYEGTDGSGFRTPEAVCSNIRNRNSLFCRQRLERANARWQAYDRFNSPNKNAFTLGSGIE